MTQRLPTIVVASPNKPDIIFTQGGTLLADLYEMGAVRDLTSFSSREFLSQFTPEALANFTHKGKIIGVPAYITRVDFYYNRVIFDDVGIDATEVHSWNDFISVAKGYVPVAAGPVTPGQRGHI